MANTLAAAKIQASTVLPVASLLSQLKHSCTETYVTTEEQRTRQYVDSPTSGSVKDTGHALCAPSKAVEPDVKAEGSGAYNSKSPPPFPGLLAAEAVDNNINNMEVACNTAIDTGPISNKNDVSEFSHASHLALVQALLFDNASNQAVQTQQPMEENISEPLQQQHNWFVVLNYIFVIYLMTSHGLSNSIATLYLSFALRVLSRFCALTVDPSVGVVVDPAAQPPPPSVSAQSLPQPATSPSHFTQSRQESMVQLQLPPLPPPPLPMLITPALMLPSKLLDTIGISAAPATPCQDDHCSRLSTTNAETVDHQHLYREGPTGLAWLDDCKSSAEDCQHQCHHEHAPFVAASLNLKVTLSVDWFSPHKGKLHGWHITGAALLRINNLPAELTTHDWCCPGIHLIGLLPGSKETLVLQLQNFLKLLIDKLKDFDSTGKVIKTFGHPDGKLVKA
ncbi:uncharacterized protein UTRI_10264 [Ustilago trichophora]|uniref:Uncharacterized protein n=1 Tax=Ustilago trichophora TaxID=86804 RepID=A0A5C3EKM7_9BASI|nr:uncharacterized protein UTRI_10264 [Ustilago trichophora]